jgi:predicted  nucleic acid-binding Zn-ribbon protein
VHDELVNVARAEERLGQARAALAALRASEELKRTQREQASIEARLGELKALLGAEQLRLEELEDQRAGLANRRERVRSVANESGFREQSHAEEEIAMLSRRIEQLEESELQAMETVEELVHEVGALEAQRDALGAEALSHLEALALERTRREAAVAAAEAEWEVALAQLSPELRQRIVARAKRGRAIALIEAGRCSACHLELSGSVLDEAQRGADVDCESCGAWLIVP